MGFIIFCGFLTQYYFCIYIILVFLILFFYLIKKKTLITARNLFLNHAIPAFFGILFFPASIYHIFFSYRGFGANDNHTKTFLENVIYYLKSLLNSVNISLILLLIVTGITTVYILKKKNKIKIEPIPFIMCFIPLPFFILIVSKIAPFLGENYTSRYIMLLYPIFVISITYLLAKIWNLKYSCPIILSILIFLIGIPQFTSKPTYLYSDYQHAMNLAKENSNKPFIYIYDNYFTHLNALPEFATYDKSLIINHNIYDFSLLKSDEWLNEQKEVILCIKNWVDQATILDKITKNTNFKKTQQLLHLNSDVESTYYLLTKA